MDTRIVIQFLGGLADKRNLTGSCILLQVEIGKNKSRFLVDCGLFQGPYKESMDMNLTILKHKPSSINGVILTHAHIDHGGRIPLLTKHGFCGRIYTTKESANLSPIMWEDNAKIQSSEMAWRNKKTKENLVPQKSSSRFWKGHYDRAKRKIKEKLKRKKSLLNETLYTTEDVKQTCSLMKNGGYEYHEWIKLAKGIDLKFYPSGHVLGGAICVLRIEKRIGFEYLGFSGDLGRSDGVILPPPEIVQEPINCWFSESTYGGKKHPHREGEIEKLLELIRKTNERKGRIIIPAFALERTQEVIYILSKAMSKDLIPKIPIFLDSPMAVKITKVFSPAWEMPGLFKGQEDLNFNPFDPDKNKALKLVITQNDSSALIASEEPGIVIAGSGMCDAGRIRGHLRTGLSNENNIVCLIGYMAEGSLGRRLKEGYPIVNMNKEEIIIRAKIEVFESFSAHADGTELVDYVKKITKNLKRIFIIHGEHKGALDYKLELIKTIGLEGKDIIIPKDQDIFSL